MSASSAVRAPVLSAAERFLLGFTRNPSLPLRLRKRLLRHRGLRAGIDFDLELFGTVCSGRTGNLIDDKVFLCRCHEPATIRLMRAVLEDDRQRGRRAVPMDVGTNTGLHLLAWPSEAAPPAG